jgi:hypothetical protein
LKIGHLLDDCALVAYPVTATAFDARLREPQPLFRPSPSRRQANKLRVHYHLRADVANSSVLPDYPKKHRTFGASPAWAIQLVCLVGQRS